MTKHSDMPDPTPAVPAFASASPARHLLRGALGFGLIAGALVLGVRFGPLSLVLLLPAMVALRGCPMCWLVGLLQTFSNANSACDCAAEDPHLCVGSAADRMTDSAGPTRPNAYHQHKEEACSGLSTQCHV